ncbi:hypothetical protein B0H14DRAFT_3517425 [Mycena olivaceomarginata]|nr:hypothetical protein B0H14DRAFT_3517425 [Mycena olivaceomarginata]
MLPRCAASPFPHPLRCHRVVPVKPSAPSHVSASNAIEEAATFLLLRRLFYRSSVRPLDLHIEIILMRIAQLCATFPLTLRRYDRMYLLVHAIFLHQKLKVGFSSALLFLFLFPLSPSLPFLLPSSPICVNDAFGAQVLIIPANH